jgi:hypothetical protein
VCYVTYLSIIRPYIYSMLSQSTIKSGRFIINILYIHSLYNQGPEPPEIDSAAMFFSICYGHCILRVKQPGLEVDLITPYRAMVENAYSTLFQIRLLSFVSLTYYAGFISHPRVMGFACVLLRSPAFGECDPNMAQS